MLAIEIIVKLMIGIKIFKDRLSYIVFPSMHA